MSNEQNHHSLLYTHHSLLHYYWGILSLPMKASCIIMVSIAACLIHRIFEVNPLRCIKCGGNMRGIACIERSENFAFITDYQTTKSILKHIGEETIRPPPLFLYLFYTWQYYIGLL